MELKASLITVFMTLAFFLPLLACIVFVREPQWSYLECFYFTFITLSTIGFGDFQPRFQNDVDYLLILVAFIGLTLISSIFCSLNKLMDSYGVSARIVRSIRGKSPKEAYVSPKDHDIKVGIDGDEEDAEDDVFHDQHLEPQVGNNLDEDRSTGRNRLGSVAAQPRREKRGSSVSLQMGIFGI